MWSKTEKPTGSYDKDEKPLNSGWEKTAKT